MSRIVFNLRKAVPAVAKWMNTSSRFQHYADTEKLANLAQKGMANSEDLENLSARQAYGFGTERDETAAQKTWSMAEQKLLEEAQHEAIHKAEAARWKEDKERGEKLERDAKAELEAIKKGSSPSTSPSSLAKYNKLKSASLNQGNPGL